MKTSELKEVRKMALTLRDIVENHPDWLDYKVVIYTNGDGDYEYVGASANVYLDAEMCDPEAGNCYSTGEKLVVFSGN